MEFKIVIIALWGLFAVFFTLFIMGSGKCNKIYDEMSERYFNDIDDKEKETENEQNN